MKLAAVFININTLHLKNPTLMSSLSKYTYFSSSFNQGAFMYSHDVMRPITQNNLDRLIIFLPYSGLHKEQTCFRMFREIVLFHFQVKPQQPWPNASVNTFLYSETPVFTPTIFGVWIYSHTLIVPSGKQPAAPKYFHWSLWKRGKTPSVWHLWKRGILRSSWHSFGESPWCLLGEISYSRTWRSSQPWDPNHFKRVLYFALSGQIPQVPLDFKIM